MTSSKSGSPVSRRTALAGIGGGGLGLAVAATARQASAQDATPAAMASHPIVGTWVIDRDTTSTADIPVVVVFTADGAFIDPNQGAAGMWEATGPNSAAMTIIPFPGGRESAMYAVVRATWEIAEDGATMSGSANVTVVAADGTVVATDELSSTATRLRVEPMANVGQPLAGFPTWTPAPPAEATPEAGTPSS